MSYNISDFDFQLPAVGRIQRGHIIPYQIVASVHVKGKKRVATTHIVNFYGLEQKFGKRPTSVAFGISKFQKKSVGLLITDNKKVPSIDIPAKLSSGSNHYPTVHNKALIMRLFNYSGVSLPEVPDTSATVYFTVEEVKGQPNVWEVRPDHAVFVDANDGISRKKLAESNGQPSPNRFG